MREEIKNIVLKYLNPDLLSKFHNVGEFVNDIEEMMKEREAEMKEYSCRYEEEIMSLQIQNDALEEKIRGYENITFAIESILKVIQ